MPSSDLPATAIYILHPSSDDQCNTVLVLDLPSSATMTLNLGPGQLIWKADLIGRSDGVHDDLVPHTTANNDVPSVDVVACPEQDRFRQLAYSQECCYRLGVEMTSASSSCI